MSGSPGFPPHVQAAYLVVALLADVQHGRLCDLEPNVALRQACRRLRQHQVRYRPHLHMMRARAVSVQQQSGLCSMQSSTYR